MIGRRGVLGLPLAVIAASSRAHASRTPPDDLSVADWTFEKTHPFVHRSLVLTPTHLAKDEKVPVLVLLHGLGEAKEGPESGVFAWLDRYGLGSTYARLRHPPVASIHKRADLTKARAAQINAELADRPFRGMVLVCPFTPNVWSFKSRDGALDALHAFVTGPLLEKVAKEIPQADTARVGLDGCSLGGYVALELLSRDRERWASFGVVQPAIGEGDADKWGKVLEDVRTKKPKTAVHLETSTHDPFLRATKALSAKLEELGTGHHLRVCPGPHDQPFLRDVGTMEMVLFHDRALR